MDPRRQDRPLIRRDADGVARTAPDWETLTERLIREAQEAGAFDDLPGQGRPLDLPDDSAAGDMAIAYHLLRNAGAVPPWILADRDVREAEGRIDALLARASAAPLHARARLERELAALLDLHDAAVLRLDTLAPTMRQQRRRLDREALIDRLDGAFGGRASGP